MNSSSSSSSDGSNFSLIDATSDALTVSWTAVPGAKRYVLQYRKASNSGDDPQQQSYETLSDQLATPQARKRNLTDVDGVGFIFRARAIKDEDGKESEPWVTHAEPYRLLSAEQERRRLPAPRAFLGGKNAVLRVTWDEAAAKAASNNDAAAAEETLYYELQMRENAAGVEWTTIAAALKGTEVRKKNLTSQNGYQFRVRPTNSSSSSSSSSSSAAAFSAPSEPVTALGLSGGLKRLFSSLEHDSLLRNDGARVPLVDALGGKEFVLLYASAHWCGPCRQFTPSLTQWYNQSMLGGSGQNNSTVEVVFLSADHDESGFRSYFKGMPWLAVDYDDDAREQLMNHIRVTGIPRLAVLDGRTGRILEDNAVGKPLDVNRWRGLLEAGRRK